MNNVLAWAVALTFSTLMGCVHPLVAPPLTDAAFASITLGEPASAIAQRFGEPFRRVSFPRTATTSWDYRYIDTWGYRAEYSVIFNDQALVQSTFQARLTRDDWP